jgi:N6-adenosine-specific RNA methylase IME4
MEDFYFYLGEKVEVLDKYDGLWIHKSGETVVKGYPGNYQPIKNAEVIPISQPSEAVKSVEATTSETSENPKMLRINEATKVEIANKLAGIGKVYATRIFERKPSEGYKDWNELQELNADLSLEWGPVIADNSAIVIF